MEDGRIKERQLSATTDSGNKNEARLFGDKAWGNTGVHEEPSITVSFDEPVTVTGIATQGKPDADDNYVIQYELNYVFQDLHDQRILNVAGEMVSRQYNCEHYCGTFADVTVAH